MSKAKPKCMHGTARVICRRWWCRLRWVLLGWASAAVGSATITYLLYRWLA